jgi:hypothetical protein
MTNKDREIAAMRLAEIDRRRAELEIVLSHLPNTPQRLDRDELETELAHLWRYRAQIAQLLAAPEPHQPSSYT